MPEIPQLIPQQAEQAIASFSSSDLASGTQFVIYQGYTSNESGTENHHLSENEVFSNIVETIVFGQSGTGVKLDLDFDSSPFNLPRTLKGTAFVSVTAVILPQTGNATVKVTAIIRTWDGSDEVDLVTADTKSFSSQAEDYKTFGIALVVPQTLIKKGTLLRLTIRFEITADGNSNTMAIGHDPKDRDGVGIVPSTDSKVSTTKLEFHAPFRPAL